MDEGKEGWVSLENTEEEYKLGEKSLGSKPWNKPAKKGEENQDGQDQDRGQGEEIMKN